MSSNKGNIASIKPVYIQTTRVYAEIQQGVDLGYTTISEQGGARSSKTYNTVIWLVDRCRRVPGTKVSIVRKTLPALRGSVLKDSEEIIEKFQLWDRKRFNKSELVFTFPNGSWIEFFSCDNETKLRGRKRDILYVNEANELTEVEWKQLKMRTTTLSIVDYNPSFSDDHWLCSVNNDPRTYYFQTTYLDNPFLEQTIIDEIESYKTQNKNLWRIYGLGLQAVIEGLVFTEVDQVDEIPVEARRHRFRAIDFGYEHDPTAIEDVYFAGHDVYIDQLCYQTHMLTSDIIKVFKANDPAIKCISESADPRLVQEIYRAGVNIHPVVKFPGSVQAGIQTMQSYRFHFTKRSTECWREARNYVWAQDKEGKWINTPVDAFNHMWDGVRYVFMNEVMGGAPRPVNLSRIASAAGR